jgi:hypothetical protein
MVYFYCAQCGQSLMPGLQMCAQCGQVFQHPVPLTSDSGENRTEYWPPRAPTAQEQAIRQVGSKWDGVNPGSKATVFGIIAIFLICFVVGRQIQYSRSLAESLPHAAATATYTPSSAPQQPSAPTYVPPTYIAPVATPQAQPPPTPAMVTCPDCGGTGRRHTCHGAKIQRDFSSLEVKWKICESCNGSGICLTCEGRGQFTQAAYVAMQQQRQQDANAPSIFTTPVQQVPDPYGAAQ